MSRRPSNPAPPRTDRGNTARGTRPGIAVAFFSLLLLVDNGLRVQAAERPLPSFRHDVLAALSKQGCSSGACHGSPTGKGGFRLSLRGFDPNMDRRTLIREAAGRRTNPLDPQRSLLLLKPTMQVPHGGGRQLAKNDLAYHLLHDWIAAGCPADPVGAAVCTRIEVEPSRGQWAWDQRRRPLRVQAVMSDGTRRDITRLAVYTSSDLQVATVAADGVVQARTGGEATVLVRYLDHIATAELRFHKPVEGFTWSAPPENNFIDRIVMQRLERLQVPPSPLCEDHEFLRRAYLDVTGILPTRDETEAFLADGRGDKRERLIDRLLDRPEHAEFWAQQWGDLLRVKAGKLSPAGVHKFHRWLVAAIRDNMPHDRFAAALLTAQGSTFTNPPANFYRAAADSNDCAESTAQLFLGIRIQCAKCHNHPFDRWSQDDYYGLAAFFSRVRRESGGREAEMLIFTGRDGEVVQPRTGATMLPRLPLAGQAELREGEDRRQALARWLADGDNRFFARVAVNRIWGQLLGRGIVEPVDDFRADNPPAHPELLDELARRFAAGGFNRRELLRSILSSRVYQLSSASLPLNEHDEKYFSHARARLLQAEQLLDAVSHVTGVQERFFQLPAGTRATALPSPDFGSEFLKEFGQPARNTVCNCERTGDPKLARALQLINGPLIPNKLQDARGRLARHLADTKAQVAAAGQPPQAGLRAWFRADAGVETPTGVPVGRGDPVSRWINQVAPRLAATQDHDDARPTFSTSAIGGLPAVEFDGTDDLLHNQTDVLLPPASPRTVFVVGRLDDDTGGAWFTFGRARTGGAAVFTAQHVRVGGRHYVYSDGVNAAGNTTTAPPLMETLRKPFVTAVVSTGVGQKLQLSVNGRARETEQTGGVGADRQAIGFTIGSREDISPGQQSWRGLICEILVYDRALDREDLIAAGTYLSTKYQLPSEFPHRTPPEIAGSTNREIVIDFYYAAFCRPPSTEELKVALQHLQDVGNRRQALVDIGWALMNSKEFAFQH